MLSLQLCVLRLLVPLQALPVFLPPHNTLAVRCVGFCVGRDVRAMLDYPLAVGFLVGAAGLLLFLLPLSWRQWWWWRQRQEEPKLQEHTDDTAPAAPVPVDRPPQAVQQSLAFDVEVAGEWAVGPVNNLYLSELKRQLQIALDNNSSAAAAVEGSNQPAVEYVTRETATEIFVGVVTAPEVKNPCKTCRIVNAKDKCPYHLCKV
jgi:hypothetical protein